jgi:hypothetical protein
VKREPSRKLIRWCGWRYLVPVFALMVIFSSCIPARLEEAQKGLEATLADLPQSSEFTVFSVISGEYYDELFGDSMCYWGQAIVAVGSSLPEEDALSSYVRELEARGWQAQNNLGRSRELVRGEHESIVVRLGAPSWMLESREDFKRRRDSFRSLVNVSVNYYLPSRAACMGEQGSSS